MRKHSQKIIAGILAAAMIVPASVNIIEPMKVSALQILGETDFTYKMLPWLTVESAPAHQRFELSDGAVHLTILSAKGATNSQYDLQFRHRNLSFQKNHIYKVSFKVKSKRKGMELVSTINNAAANDWYFVLNGETGQMEMGPYFNGSWGNPLKMETEYKTYSGTFIPKEDIMEAEWSFRYANDENGWGGDAVEGDEIWFDDMSIEDTTEEPGTIPPELIPGAVSRNYITPDNNYISVNQLGYYPGLAKHATLSDNQGDLNEDPKILSLEGSYDYEIVQTSDDTVAYTGKTGDVVPDADTGDNICKIDFSEFDQPGTYYIRIKDKEWRSLPFRIGNDIYSDPQNDLLTNALNYFYQNRAGLDITQDCITSGNAGQLAHSWNRDDSIGFVQRHLHDYPLQKPDDAEYYGSSKIDTKGGWYSGVNYNKNMIEGGMSLWTLQNMYERAAFTKNGTDKFADQSGKVVVPEIKNGVPDILDECRYELDFMAKMKVQSDEPTWGDYAGLYYHGAEGVGFENTLDYEHEYHAAYAVYPPSYAATLNYAACAAQAARLWAEYDADYAAELLQNAKDAFGAYKKYSYVSAEHEEYNFYVPLDFNRPGLIDNDNNVDDDAYWAACELYISSQAMNDPDADTYYEELSNYVNAFQVPNYITGGYNGTGDIGNGSYTTFNIGNTGAAGSLSLMMHPDTLSRKDQRTLSDSIREAADSILETEEKQGYGIPYRYDSPGMVDSLDPTILYEGWEYNSNGRALNNMFALAYAYDLTGDKKYLNGVTTGMDYLLGNNALSYSFITGYGSYHVQNPAHRYWINEVDSTMPKAPDGVIVSGPSIAAQEAYLRALYCNVKFDDSSASGRYYADSIEAWSTNDSELSTNASLAWIVAFLQEETAAAPVIPGDVDKNGETNNDDAAMLLAYLTGKPSVPDAKAADLDNNGKLNAIDLALLKRMLLQ